MTLNICSSYFYVPSAAIMGLGHHCHLKNILNITSTGSTSGKINRFTNSTSTVLFCTRFIWQRNAEPGMDNMGQFLSTPSNREPFFSRWIIWSPKKCICSFKLKDPNSYLYINNCVILEKVSKNSKFQFPSPYNGSISLYIFILIALSRCNLSAQ